MKIVVLDSATLGADVTFDKWESLGELTVYPTTPAEKVTQRLENCDVAILNKVKITEEILNNLPNLKLICITATGFDNVDISACKKRNVAVCNVKGYSTHSVAQVTLSLSLALATKLPDYSHHVKSGAYTAGGIQNCLTPVFHELYGKTWGIVGMGNIGRQVARVAEAMGCNILAFRRTPDKEYSTVSLDELCERSDIISLHLPLSEETKGLINADKLSKMKPTAVLINVARGAVIDEEAVTSAIEKGRLAGFGTDVFSPEPLNAESPLNRVLGRSNVIATPHMAWGAYEARIRCINEIAENIKSFLKGEIRNRVEVDL